MISQSMQSGLNSHIQAEKYSSYLYLAMSAYCEAKNFAGFGRWLRVQSTEENEHALKMLDHLLTRGGRAEFKAIEAPPVEYGSMLELFETVQKHERHVTDLIHKLYETARNEKDLATQVFLQWYVDEQVQEEASASEIVEKLRMVGDKGSGVLYLDKEYGKRGA
jgi:ferritin